MSDTIKTTPLAVRIVLHVHCAEELPEFASTRPGSEAKQLIECDIIKGSDKDGYCLTPRGEAYLKMLLSLPYPERVWRNPETKEVVE